MKRKRNHAWINPITLKFRKYAQGLIFFKGPFCVYFGFIFGGAYVRREISLSKSIELPS